MQHTVSPFPVQPCPVCGADTKYRVWKHYTRSLYHGIASKKLGKLENIAMGGSPVTPLVCTQCGYVQLFVNPDDFRDEPE